jgi:hypothetical protein
MLVLDVLLRNRRVWRRGMLIALGECPGNQRMLIVLGECAGNQR